MRAALLWSSLLLLVCSHCTQQPVDSVRLKHLLAQPEYVASGDGWAEARRRTLLKRYLSANGIPFHEVQEAKPGGAHDKYKQVTIVIPGSNVSSTAGYAVTLALLPGRVNASREAIASRQPQCDAVLFRTLEHVAALREQYKHILLTMDQTCRVEGLTGRLGAAK